MFWGIGSTDLVFDGTSVVAGYTPSGNVYSLSSQTPIIYKNIIINSGVTVQFNGANQVPRIYVSGTLTINGILSCNGGNASGQSGGSQALVNCSTPGGNGGAANTNGSGGAQPGTPALGGGGGAGGSSGSGQSGGNGGPVDRGTPYSMTDSLFPDAFYGKNMLAGGWTGGAGGGGGGGSASNTGGGGGGGAGVIIVNALTVVNNGTIQCRGGNGANGTGGDAGGGGGGGGGKIVVNTSATPTGTGAMDCSGGTAGLGVGLGQNGTAGQAGNVTINIWT